ncbi:hypothetical protein BP5796_09685 [Coleophoma crateriformis]|uniref:Protein kinase domain-containing protein n=1 Tax=Coleophoma crateriformis TaxID=565419 RepID=A0A3D8QYR2_9HELO|nr:hypothetical protein BP5796_09685 [Coleophoma crateriformis]
MSASSATSPLQTLAFRSSQGTECSTSTQATPACDMASADSAPLSSASNTAVTPPTTIDRTISQAASQSKSYDQISSHSKCCKLQDEHHTGYDAACHPTDHVLQLPELNMAALASRKADDDAQTQPGPAAPDAAKQKITRHRIRRSVSHLFHMTHLHSPINHTIASLNKAPLKSANASEPTLLRDWKINTLPETSAGAPKASTSTSTSSLLNETFSLAAPEIKASLACRPTRRRSSAAPSFLEAVHCHVPRISFAALDNKRPEFDKRSRASSMDLETALKHEECLLHGPEVEEIQQHMWGISPPTGAGRKARRLSQKITDDFNVHTTELYDDYSDQSKLVGRRGRLLGRGATAQVKLMIRKGCSSDLYAVKEFRGKAKHEKTEDYEKKVKSEYSIAKSAHHPNIVKTVSLCIHNGRWNHVMEFCDQGDLFHLVQKRYLCDKDHLKDRLCLFKQLVQGINYLHGHGIAHRDIKLENLLMTEHGHLKITDFGVSEVFCGIHPGVRSAGGECGKEMKEVRLCTPGICGSMPYIAPEVIAKQGEYDPRAIDVWSAAIVMISMTANGTLWPEAQLGSSMVYDSLVGGWQKWNSTHKDEGCINESDYPYVSFFDTFINPPALRRILLTMLNPDPSKRVTIHKVATNRWLKTIECCQADSEDGDEAVVIDASKTCPSKALKKIGHHNHLPPEKHAGHRIVRLPGSN